MAGRLPLVGFSFYGRVASPLEIIPIGRANARSLSSGCTHQWITTGGNTASSAACEVVQNRNLRTGSRSYLDPAGRETTIG